MSQITRIEDDNNRQAPIVIVKKNAPAIITYGFIHVLAFLFALYLLIKCNNKISPVSLIVAIFCPWIYIIWILATRRGICSDYVRGVAPVTI